MSRTFELLHKAKQAHGATVPAPASPHTPAKIEDEVPYIEVGGPDQIEASADVLACPPPTRKLFLPTPPASETPKSAPQAKSAPATIPFFSWQG